MINVGLIGYGGIAQAAHVPSYQNLQKAGKAQLVAACDIDPDRFKNKIEINISSQGGDGSLEINYYTDLEQMLSSEKIDMLDICLPTPLHAGMVIDMLNRGYHVLSEKPMARTYQDGMRMVEAAKKSKGKLMIGQCLRFFPDYAFVKAAVESGAFGKPLSAVFRRMSPPPVWGWDNWYMDSTRSGGCLLDMHIHDIDMARYLFGEPAAVSCLKQDVYSGFDIVQSRLYYKDLPVLAIGDWSQEGATFTADFIIAFEKATLSGAGGAVSVCPRGGEKYQAELSSVNGYEGEIAFFVDMIQSGEDNIKNPPESAAQTLKLIETLRQSALNGGEKTPFEAGEL